VSHRNSFLSALDSADREALAPSLANVFLTRGDPLFEVGERAVSIYFPLSAVLSVVTMMSDGRCVETGTIGRESGAGLMDGALDEEASSRVFTQVSGLASRLPAWALRGRLRESPELVRLLLTHLRGASRQTELNAACNMVHDLEARLARWLLMTADRTGEDNFTLTQEYMAVMTGAQRTTVSATAAGLKRARLIRYTRGRVCIEDRPGLTARACECYRDARTQFESLQALSGPGLTGARAGLDHLGT
jgi:CRP-like cAMP-binding protein